MEKNVENPIEVSLSEKEHHSRTPHISGKDLKQLIILLKKVIQDIF